MLCFLHPSLGGQVELGTKANLNRLKCVGMLDLRFPVTNGQESSEMGKTRCTPCRRTQMFDAFEIFKIVFEPRSPCSDLFMSLISLSVVKWDQWCFFI
ncbi:hypothetical protein UPYG_G00336870 [Umbra pygmaea]|uniref:Uncharacterized protein n=1 Tax=Umbra pygmaea TaxID=75934 RepID=A0ABD0VX75_UMBPY